MKDGVGRSAPSGDPSGRAERIRRTMRDPSLLPRPALLLGGLGLLPTLLATGLVWFGAREQAAVGFSLGAIYGAMILSFLGGAWWGLAVSKAEPERLAGLLAIAVTPSLVAWLAIFALSAQTVAVLAASFLGALMIDRRLTIDGLAPAWWMRLRIPLSTAMALLHLLLALGAMIRGY